MVAAGGGAQGALEGPEGQLEVDGVVGLGGLQVVVVEDEVDREGGPDLGARVGDDGEADRVIVEADPGDLFEGVEGGDEFWGAVVSEKKGRKGGWDGMGGVGLLEKVRIFRRSVLNRISSWYHVRYPMLWVDMEYVVGNGVCREDGLPEFVNFQEEGKVASRLGAHTFPPL